VTVITLPEHPPVTTDPSIVAPRQRWVARLARGRVEDPAWVRPSLVGLLVATGVLYLWGLGASGWANAFYSAAVQAGSSSWKAFFFGSFDAANAITVDKPPASLWVMSLSARLFGVNAWSILVPQALMGVVTVGVVFASVRRWFSAGAGLIAGAVVAVTPVAALMFRFNNPDALLVLLLTVAAYAVLRALETASVRWMALAGVLVGFGFLTKMLQAFIVLPAFGLVYLLAAPASFWRRVWHVMVLGLATLAASGWWVAVVELWPASSRPYIGGSQHNSVLELVFGYNGFGRLTGNESGSVGGGPANTAGRWGPTGWLRMFNDSFGGQISWLMPAALIVLAVGLIWTLRRSRTDQTRAALLLWGGWLVITGVVFSLGEGIIHEYYSVALTPAIGALVGIGAAFLWKQRAELWSRVVMAGIVVVTARWAIQLLDRSPTWNRWLHPLIFVAAALGAVLLLLLPLLRTWAVRLGVVAALVAALVGPFTASVATATTPHTGAIPTAAPAVATGGRLGGPGGFGGFGGGGFGGGGTGAPPANGGGRTGTRPAGAAAGGGTRPGGLLDASAPAPALVAKLEEDAGRYRWIAATIGANEAAGYQLATDDPIMAIGGFNGTDPSPTLAEFEARVQAGEIHWFIAGGGFGGFGGGRNAITSWVEQHYTSVSVGGITLYDLTARR
jgi:4-amino-4-deoxy-L-arabinose transferase-like glycosyltransferase